MAGSAKKHPRCRKRRLKAEKAKQRTPGIWLPKFDKPEKPIVGALPAPAAPAQRGIDCPKCSAAGWSICNCEVR